MADNTDILNQSFGPAGHEVEDLTVPLNSKYSKNINDFQQNIIINNFNPPKIEQDENSPISPDLIP